MTREWRRWSPLAAVALASACAVTLPRPAPEHAGGDAVLLERLEAGRSLTAAKCGGCHAYYLPEELSDRDWELSVAKMIRLGKAKLASDERDLIVRYLTSLNGRD